MSKVAVVTDSTATIPDYLVNQHQILVGPCVVIFGESTYRDGVDIKPSEFYHRLQTDSTIPTTSQVPVIEFKNIFTRLHEEGYDILCLVLSDKLSNTLNSAVQAKEMVPQANIEIVNSLSVAMALGFQAIEVAKYAAQGASLAECKALAEKNISSTGVFIAPETLEYLHRGGRIGGATRFLGTALNIRPMLELVGGRLEPVERVRTRKKMLARIIDLVEERIGGRTPVRIAAVHANSPNDASELLEMAKARLNPIEAIEAEVSPAIGTHTGPGTIGIVFMAGVE